MDATSLALSWLLLAQTGAGTASPFNLREQNPNLHRAAPAAALQEEERPATPWAEQNSNRTLREFDEKAIHREKEAAAENHAPFYHPGATESAAPSWSSNSGQNRALPTTPALIKPNENRNSQWPATRDADVRPTSNSADEHLDGALLIPLRSRSGSNTPAEVIDHALHPAANLQLPGRPLTLIEVLSRTSDRSQQLKATKAYWRLALAEAEYYWRADTKRWTSQLSANRGRVNDLNVLRTLQAAAVARLTEAELAILQSQHELADLIHVADFEQLPLATDQPFVGSYRTYFDQLYGDREAPGRTRLIDQSLPIRLEQIEARTKGIFSSDEAMHTAINEYTQGQADVHTLWFCLEDLHRERREFSNAVREYNFEIAEYALTSATNNTSTATLAAMMIRTPRTATATSAPTPSANRNNTFLQRQPSEPTRAVRPIEYLQPEPAPEYSEHRKPVSVMVPSSSNRLESVEFQNDAPPVEPRKISAEVELQATHEVPKRPVSVLVHPIRE
ncbi:MAG TPA: hypothetical protein VFE24_17800 [Pirellulales bacterium]|jgi:hypothetical protein|nr:hypothetical protein [Pirellulales bacterium]